MRPTRFVALAATLMLVLTGCTPAKRTGTGSLGTVSVTASPSRTPSPTPAGTHPRGTGGGGSGRSTPAKPPYPTTAKDYGQTMVDGLFSGATDRVTALIDDQAYDDLARTRFPDAHDWHFYSCGAFSVNQTQCLYDNGNGDRLTIALSTALIGRAHAIHGVTIDGTRYQADAVGMTQSFFDAWVAGNTYRMRALSVDGFTESWLRLHPAAPSKVTAYVTSADSTASYTAVTGVGSDQSNYEVVVVISLLGQPHAIMAKPV